MTAACSPLLWISHPYASITGPRFRHEIIPGPPTPRPSIFFLPSTKCLLLRSDRVRAHDPPRKTSRDLATQPPTNLDGDRNRAPRPKCVGISALCVGVDQSTDHSTLQTAARARPPSP